MTFARHEEVSELQSLKDGDRQWTREWKWVLVRLALGGVQIAGAAVSFVLLAQLGVTSATVAVVVATGLCTTVSVLLFGRRR